MAPPVVQVTPHQRRIAAQDQQVFRVARLRRPGEIVAAGDDDGVRLRGVDEQHLVVRGGVTGFQSDRDAALGQPLLGFIDRRLQKRIAHASMKIGEKTKSRFLDAPHSPRPALCFVIRYE